MLAYQGIFLAMTIWTASVVLADVLVQPGYHYDNNRHNPSYQPATVPQQQPLFPTDQYYAKQFTDQQVPYPRRVQVVHPHNGHQDYRSYFVGYPYHHNPYVIPHHMHYTKLGGHVYTRPSVFVHYSHPKIGHHRFRRSSLQSHDTTVEELTEANHNEVATKPSLMTTKYPTVVDSHLQGNEPAGTDNKRSEGKRQSKNDRATTGSLLLGLYPQNMYRSSHQVDATSDPTKSSSTSIRQNVRNVPSGKSTLDSIIVVNPIQETTTANSQGSRLEEDNKNQQQNQTPLTDPNQTSSPTLISSSNRASNEEKPASIGAARDNYYIHGRMFEWPELYKPVQYEAWHLPSFIKPLYIQYNSDPRQYDVSMKLEPPYQQNEYPASDKKSSLKSRKYIKERSKPNQLIGASNPNNDYRTASFCNPFADYSEYRPVYDVIPVEMHNTYEPITYPIDLDDYATYKSSGAQINTAPTTDIVQTLPYMAQLSSTYNNPTKYVALPQTYYHFDPALTYDSAPFEDTFSLSNYY